MDLVFTILGVLKLGMNHDLCEEVLISIRKVAGWSRYVIVFTYSLQRSKRHAYE